MNRFNCEFYFSNVWIYSGTCTVHYTNKTVFLETADAIFVMLHYYKHIGLPYLMTQLIRFSNHIIETIL